MHTTAEIFNIQHFSLNDGPGIRTVVFFKGCPLSCAWCHNPESKSAKSELSFLKEKCLNCRKCAEVCPSAVHSFTYSKHSIDRSRCTLCGKCAKACLSSALEILGKAYTAEEIMLDIEKDDVFFGSDGGVTFSGGEPFMQFDMLYTLLKECKQRGYSTCIETSGYTAGENILSAAAYTDYFLFDYKLSSSQAHKKYTGVSNRLILENLALLNRINSSVILRCPIIPGINDNREHFQDIAELCNEFSCIKSAELMPYHPLGIAKAEQIGKACGYTSADFAKKEAIELLCNEIKPLIRIPIKFN